VSNRTLEMTSDWLIFARSAGHSSWYSWLVQQQSKAKQPGKENM
jgi:hypothetical protein